MIGSGRRFFVELGGPESSLLLDRGAELMRSIESLTLEALPTASRRA